LQLLNGAAYSRDHHKEDEMASLGKFSLVVAVAGLTAFFAGAQTGKQQTKVIVMTPPAQVSCPIAMQAQHSPGLRAEVRVGKGGNGSFSHHGMGQHMELTLNNAKARAISEVRIRVRGWSAKVHTMPAQSTNSAYSDASRILDVKVNIAPHGTAKTDVWVRGMTAVDAIDLIGVSYENGSSWEPASLQVCSIIPNGTMLISER
jgi:hypothetical protein